MKKLGVIAFFIIVIAVVFYRGGESEGVKAENQPVSWQCGVVLGTGDEHFDSCVVIGYDFTKVITLKKRSFIPIGIHGFPENNPELIFNVLNRFENHFNTKIINWRIQINLYTDEISGIWVDHGGDWSGYIK